jgi:hypothetical protein
MYILLLNSDTLFYEESQVNVCLYFQLFFKSFVSIFNMGGFYFESNVNQRTLVKCRIKYNY